ncbi:MAG: helix-turn-helix domain-containing protein [Candidatus Dormibacteria bacterium]
MTLEAQLSSRARPLTGVPLLRLGDVMVELGIGRTKVHALIWSGELPVVRIGRAIRVRRTDLDAFIDAHLSPKGTGDGTLVPLVPAVRPRPEAVGRPSRGARPTCQLASPWQGGR